MAKPFFRDLAEAIKDEDTTIAADGLSSAEFSGFIDTGSYVLNAALSGSLYGGAPNNKVVAFAGETSVGKTFLMLSIAASFLRANPTGGVIYYDTESAVTKKMMEDHGVDTTRVIKSEPDTIQKFRHHVIRVLDGYMKTPEAERPPMMMVLDSLGMLSSEKEMADTAEGKDTRDMTKAQLIRATFRTITLKLARARVPLFLASHVYAAVGCMVAGSMVRMADGSLRDIVDVTIGDSVETLVGPKPVIATYRYEGSEVFDVELEDRSVLTVTGGHKFMTQDMNWKTVSQLRVGDHIVRHGYQPPVQIVRMRLCQTPQTVYDFGVQDAHHYVLNNGVVSHNSYVPTLELSGGGGLKYAASTIAFLSKKKDRDDASKEVVGNFIKVKMHKSRLSKENVEVTIKLSYAKGLDKWYGLLDLAEEAGVFKKVSTRYELPDGGRAFGKSIESEPERYFTQPVLDAIEDYVRRKFNYGTVEDQADAVESVEDEPSSDEGEEAQN